MTSSNPLTRRAKKHRVVIQCVTRTSAECRAVTVVGWGRPRQNLECKRNRPRGNVNTWRTHPAPTSAIMTGNQERCSAVA